MPLDSASGSGRIANRFIIRGSERRRSMRSRRFQTLLAGLIMAVLASARLSAQSAETTGIIEGTVVDASGAALPGVAVTIRNTATGFEQTLTTNRQGRFRSLQLPLGPYKVTAALQGFATLVREGVRLGVGMTVSLD